MDSKALILHSWPVSLVLAMLVPPFSSQTVGTTPCHLVRQSAELSAKVLIWTSPLPPPLRHIHVDEGKQLERVNAHVDLDIGMM
mmetsp:Transcript_31842/g.56192  ORF Transcript_31842/g.56192 Transcript_31842/m.56192 type:complete len:84 (-) Transcript_31842:720-971(-)